MGLFSDTREAFNNITDCFSGADGGVAFIMTKSMIEQLVRQAEAGDDKARQTIEVVHQMSRLIDAAQRHEARRPKS